MIRLAYSYSRGQRHYNLWPRIFGLNCTQLGLKYFSGVRREGGLAEVERLKCSGRVAEDDYDQTLSAHSRGLLACAGAAKSVRKV